MEQVLGNTLFSIKAFDKEKFEEFKSYVSHQCEDADPLILSSSAIAVLREMASHLEENQRTFDPKEYQFKEILLYEQAVDELLEKNIFDIEDDIFTFDNKKLLEHFHCQSIVKNFDQTSLFRN